MYEMTLPSNASLPPVANDDSASTTVETSVTIDVAANDTDPNGNLDPSSATLICGSPCLNPANGSLVNNGNGTFNYTPNSSFTGTDSFVYEICDLDLQCDSAAVTITVTERPDVTTVYVSSSSSGTAGGVSFADEDILAYDSTAGTWSMFFDGSSAGLPSGDVDAFHIDGDGSILFSLSSDGIAIPNVGTIDDSDIVRFRPSTGIFEWYFDGSDVGLDTSSEDIDAIGFLPDGRLVVSTSGSFGVSGVSGQDEDLIAFDDTSLGETTAGSWALYFDGTDVGLDTSSAEDVHGTWIDDNETIYLTTRDAFAVTGVSGDAADIFTCTPGTTGDNTSCTFDLFWDGSANGFDGEIVDGFALGVPAGSTTTRRLLLTIQPQPPWTRR